MKQRNRLLSVLLCLALTLGLLAGLSLSAQAGQAVVLDDELPIIPIVQRIKLTEHSISLGGKIGVNFYLEIPSQLLSNGTYITLNGEPVTPVKTANGKYVVSKALPAKEMNDEVRFEVHNKSGAVISFLRSGTSVNVDVYSVQRYLQEVIASEADYDALLVELCKALSDYGSCTQKVLNYKVEDAQALYFPEEIAAVSADEYGCSYSPATGSIRFFGGSLLTKSETTLRLYFQLSGDLNEFSATIDGAEAQLTDAGNGYAYVQLENISAKNLADGHSFTVSHGAESVTVEGYSAYSYVRQVLRTPNSESLLTAAKALKRYGDLAAAYFAQQNP